MAALLEDTPHFIPRGKSPCALMRRGPAETKNTFTIHIQAKLEPTYALGFGHN